MPLTDTDRSTRATYTYTIDDGLVLILEEHTTRISVTNDAEEVVQDLVRDGIDVDAHIILYRSATGRGEWDGLATRGGRFTDFFILSEFDQGRAVSIGRYIKRFLDAQRSNRWHPEEKR